MKRANMKFAPASIALALVLSAPSAHATGVSAGTLIENTATATYNAGSSSVSVSSNTVKVTVDELLDVAVASLAQTISNTAQALWSQQGRSFSASSNTVAFQVLRQSAVIDTFVPTPNSGQSFAFNPSNCGGQAIAIPGGLGVGDHVASLERTGTLRIGDVLFFRLIAPVANTDPATVDSILATLTTTSGERETITVMETSANSGVFVGAVPSTAIPPQPEQGDCRLSVAAGDVVSVDCH